MFPHLKHLDVAVVSLDSLSGGDPSRPFHHMAAAPLMCMLSLSPLHLKTRKEADFMAGLTEWEEQPHA